MSELRNKIAALQTYDYHIGFEEIEPMDGDYLLRTEVLAVAEKYDSEIERLKTEYIQCAELNRFLRKSVAELNTECTERVRMANEYESTKISEFKEALRKAIAEIWLLNSNEFHHVTSESLFEELKNLVK